MTPAALFSSFSLTLIDALDTLLVRLETDVLRLQSL